MNIPAPRAKRKSFPHLATLLWVTGLVPGMSLMGLYSHLGADSGVALGRLVTAEQVLRAGAGAVGLWLLVLALCGVGAWLDDRRRRWMPQVVWLATLVLLTGVFLSVALTMGAARWDALWLQRLGSVGGLVSLVCWLRSLSLAFKA